MADGNYIRKGREESRRSSELAAHLRAHRVSLAEAATGVTEALLLRMPPPPEGWAFYELPDAGRRSVAGMRVRRGRSDGVSFLLAASVKQGTGTFKSAQFVLGDPPGRLGQTPLGGRSPDTARRVCAMEGRRNPCSRRYFEPHGS